VYHSCGGCTIAINMNHSVADGEACFTFMNDWASLSRGESISAPTFDRSFLIPSLLGETIPSELSEYKTKPKPQPAVISDKKDIKFTLPEMSTNIFSFLPQVLEQMKKDILNDLPSTDKDSKISSNDVLCALIWKCITKARGFTGDEIIKLGMAINGRKRMNPVAPDRFLGNCNYWGTCSMSASVLTTSSLASLSLQIRQMVNSFDNQRIKMVNAFLTANSDKTALLPNWNGFLGSDISFTSWRFPVHLTDFGFGRPSYFGIPNLSFDGICIITSGLEADSINVAIGLKKEHFENLLRDEEFLRYLPSSFSSSS